MTSIEQARADYEEKRKATQNARMYEGANNARMGGALAAEAQAAATYISALEEADRIRQAEAAHPHRKPGKAQ